MPPGKANPPGWRPPFLAAALLWNMLALLGALASHSDAPPAAAHASLAMTLLRFVLLHLPLSALSLVLALGFDRAEQSRPRLARLLLAYLATLLVFVPLLCAWQSAMDSVFNGKPLVTPIALIERQSALNWWFNALMLSIAYAAHLAYSTWRHAHAQTLAWQAAQQGNLALRLRLLQGQLEPYFLSSALAGIGKLNRTAQREQATRALARLSDLLRYALRASQSDWQSVADEVRFMRDYVDMQGICHGGDGLVEWRIEPCDWADYRCPPLLLFPMLEQALGACLAGGTPAFPIVVGIVRERCGGPGRVRVEVAYPHGGGAGGGEGGALAVMAERLAMLYGAAATLSATVDGALVRLRLAYPVSHHDE